MVIPSALVTNAAVWLGSVDRLWVTDISEHRTYGGQGVLSGLPGNLYSLGGRLDLAPPRKHPLHQIGSVGVMAGRDGSCGQALAIVALRF